jgi:phosphoglycerate kinase
MMKTIDDVAVEGRRVLVRADLNVPLDGDRIADDGRIRASLPTLTALISRGARVIVCAHLGRPGGQPDLKYSLAPVAAHLGALLGQEVDFPGDIVGPQAHAAIAAMRPRRSGHAGKPALRSRRDQQGRHGPRLLCRSARGSVDLYVADGFGAMHRKHASVYDVPLRCVSAAATWSRPRSPRCARLTAEIQRPYVVVLGGAKVADRFDAFGHLLGTADRILSAGPWPSRSSPPTA